jgi:malate dehydrogenase
MKKISIIGAGNVGATAAMNIARMGICDSVVLLDIKEGIAEGKAMDIMQTLTVFGINTEVVGVTNDYSATQYSDIIVITSGVPRKPGMTREELVGVNKGVVESVMNNLLPYQLANAIYLVVSNPMDTMTQAVLNILRKQKIALSEKKVIGMGGMLDSARFKYFIKKAYEKKTNTILPIDHIGSGYVIGGHGDTTMVPVIASASITVKGIVKPISEIFTATELDEIVENTKKGGATLTKLLGTSAWEAPAAGIAATCEAILKKYNMHMWIPSSVWREEYGLCIGSYVTLNDTGVGDIYMVEGDNPDFKNSIAAVNSVNQNL